MAPKTAAAGMATPILILALESKPPELPEEGALLVSAGLGVGSAVDVDVNVILVILEALVLPSNAAVGRASLFVVRLK